MILLLLQTKHARFDVLKRTYEYHVNTFKDPFLQEAKLVLSN
jgi:tRNA pseudouridine38-40 synthase